MDDPSTKTSTIVIAGANDIKNTQYASEEEYAQSVVTSLKKFEEMVINQPKDKFVIVNSTPIFDDYSAEREQEAIRRQYLHRVTEELVEKNPLGNIKIQGVKYQTDDTGHPTIDGTLEILEQISSCAEHIPNLVWNEDFATAERPYSGVQGIFKYGCNHCGAHGKFIAHEIYKNPHLCDKCHEINKDTAMKNEYPILMELQKEAAEVKKKRLTMKRGIGEDDDIEFKREKLHEKGGSPIMAYAKVTKKPYSSSGSDTVYGDGH